MPIYELGYRHWEGPLTSPWLRWWVISRTGIALAFRSKILRRLMILAWGPLLYFAPLFFFIGYVTDPARKISEGDTSYGMVRAFLGSELAERMKDDPESVRPAAWSMAFHYFFSYSQSWLLLLVVAIVGPPLIAQDVRSKAFLLYFSKPIDRATYLAGKAGVVLFYVWSVTLFPALVLYAISIAFSPSISAFVQTMGLMGQIGAVSLIIGVPATLIVLCFSSLTSDGRYATFGWITYWLLGEISYTLFSNLPALKNSEWVFLLSIRKTTSVLVEHVFNVSGQLVSIVGEEPRFRDLYDSLGAQYPALSAYVLLCAISAVCLAVVVRRISAPMRI